MKVQNRTFIISGGASGLGKGSALELVQAGGYVALLDRVDPEVGQAVEKELGSSAKFFHCDVLDTESIAKAVQGAVDWASKTGKPLGGVIPAAGVNLPAAVCSLDLYRRYKIDSSSSFLMLTARRRYSTARAKPSA
jgi:NAD(P)-dependent dehydrogenase (short-subunit alcohol dehydrogenase family)